jgi:hypothetical protein
MGNGRVRGEEGMRREREEGGKGEGLRREGEGREGEGKEREM